MRRRTTPPPPPPTMPSICNGSSAAVPAASASAVPGSTNGDPAAAAADAPCSRILVTYLEKRARNLDKRKAKLDGYLQKENAGEKLDRDQKEALKQLPVVVGMIECLKETMDHVIKTITEEEKKLEKQQRKLAKRQQIDSHKQTVNFFVHLMKLQKLLEYSIGKSATENVLTDDELNKLSLLQQMVTLSVNEKSDLSIPLGVNAENAVNYIQGKDGTYGGCEFKVFREIVKRVEDSQFVVSDLPQAEEKFEEKNIQETTLEGKDVIYDAAEVASSGNVGVLESTRKLTSPFKPLVVEAETVLIDRPDAHISNFNPHPFTAEVPPRAMKEPQEILSAVRGNYNFLQDSEIDEPEKTIENLAAHGFNAYESFVPLPSGYSVAPSHSVHPDPHQLIIQQPMPFSGHLLTLPYPQTLVNESIYMTHGLPAGYSNGMAMTSPYTMHDAYSQPIVSHDLNGMMVPTTAYYDMATPLVVGQQEVTEHTDFETLDAAQTESAEAVELTEAVDEQLDEEEKVDATSCEIEKKKFSMNPNADVFRSKNYPEAEGEFAESEHSQGGYGGRRIGRGGRGGRGSYQGYYGRGNYRGQGYGGRGGGYFRHPRNDYRQDGQNDYGSDYGGWQNGPRRDRGGRSGHPRGRGGRGGYERSGPQGGTSEAQE